MRAVLLEEEAGKCLFCSTWRRSVRVWLAERIFLFLQFFGGGGGGAAQGFFGVADFFSAAATVFWTPAST